METVIYHVDVNSAFLSWEASYRVNILGASEDLRSIPSVVGGSEADRHGIVLAKSIPCRPYRIATGEPLVSARKKCPDLVVVPPNYEMYVTASRGLMQLLREYSPAVSQYSIDESFVDMTGTGCIFGSPVCCAIEMKERIKRELGFTVNIGVSSNKLLAKMASDFKKPDNVHTLFPEEVPRKMWPLPVSDLFYVGPRTTARLHALGIHTIGELAKADPAFLRAHFHSHGDLIREFANGNGELMDKVTVHPANKGYGNSMTVPYDVRDADSARQVLLSLTETVAARIRADGAFVSVVSVSITDCDFMHASRQMTLPSATNITRQIYEAACTLFDMLWDHSPIRQLGVHTGKAAPAGGYQYSLFDTFDADRQQKLDAAIDSIRLRYGEDAVMRASFARRGGKLRHMSGGLDRARRTGMTKPL